MAATKSAGATKTVEEAVAKAQDQYIAAVEQAQGLALEGYKAWLDLVAKMGVPALPGLAGMYQLRADMFEGLFDFGAAMIENQRTFAKKILETAEAAQN